MAEFNYKWHTHAPDPATADRMLRELAVTTAGPKKATAESTKRNKEEFYGGE